MNGLYTPVVEVIEGRPGWCWCVGPLGCVYVACSQKQQNLWLCLFLTKHLLVQVFIGHLLIRSPPHTCTHEFRTSSLFWIQEVLKQILWHLDTCDLIGLPQVTYKQVKKYEISRFICFLRLIIDTASETFRMDMLGPFRRNTSFNHTAIMFLNWVRTCIVPKQRLWLVKNLKKHWTFII